MPLLKSKQVAMVHGSACGVHAYHDFVRIIFTMDCGKLRKAFARTGIFG